MSGEPSAELARAYAQILEYRSMRDHLEKRLDAATARAERAEAALRRVVAVGHNNDCLYCGFKDGAVRKFFEQAVAAEPAGEGE